VTPASVLNVVVTSRGSVKPDPSDV
jgi:hypothetical protein